MVYVAIYLVIGVILSQFSFIEYKKYRRKQDWGVRYKSVLITFIWLWIIIAPIQFLINKKISRDLFYWSAGLLVFILAFYK